MLFINQHGVDELSILNKIKNYHTINNLSVDRMHDILEEVAHDDLLLIFNILMKDKKLILIEYLNLKMNSTFYTPKHARNKPHC